MSPCLSVHDDELYVDTGVILSALEPIYHTDSLDPAPACRKRSILRRYSLKDRTGVFPAPHEAARYDPIRCLPAHI